MAERNNSPPKCGVFLYKMTEYDNISELELKAQIEEAIEDNDLDEAKELMQQLISLQEDAPKLSLTDEELSEMGVDMMLVQKERRLAKAIKQAEQDGDFIESKRLMRELRVTQQLQPVQPGVRIGK